MQQLTISYRLFGFIPLRFRRTIPERWEDLTHKQLSAIGSMYLEHVGNNARMAALIYTLPLFVAKKLSDFHLYKLLARLSFLSDFKPHSSFFIKKLKGYSSPRPRLENMSFGQFIFADTYFINYANTKDPILLAKMIAALYAPPGKPFCEGDIKERAKQMQTLPMATQQAVFINYRLIKEWLTQAYPLVFVKPYEPDEDTKKVEKKSTQNTGDWLKVFDNIVGDDIVNTDKYAIMPAHTVFRFITRKIKENAKH